MRILVLEDNVRLAELMAEKLLQQSAIVDLVTTITAFHDHIETYKYDLFVVDLMLPDGDGLSVVRALRRARRTTPILVVTGRTAVKDRVAGLECGADDYLIKPFHEAEFVARVNALLRRPKPLRPRRIQVGRVILDCVSGDVICGRDRVELRPSERRLLALFVERAGRTVPRETIESALQSAGHDVTANAVEQAVSRLRKALRSTPSDVNIKTVRGSGYLLEASGPQ